VKQLRACLQLEYVERYLRPLIPSHMLHQATHFLLVFDCPMTHNSTGTIRNSISTLQVEDCRRSGEHEEGDMVIPGRRM
jgi:hypothetical protein